MRRIAVIGNGGGGKSTLARALGARLGIPVHVPLRTHLWWTAKRRLRWRETPDGRRRPPSRLMLRTILHVHRRYRPTIEDGLRPHAAKVVALRSPRELRAFLEDPRPER